MGTCMQSRSEVEKRILNEIKSNLSLLAVVVPRPDIIPVRKKDKVIYISSPITSGLRMYRHMRKHNLTKTSEIDGGTLLEKIMYPNIKESVELSEVIRTRGYRFIIVPGHFIADGWTQEHYLDLWTKVIRDFTHVVCFNAGWEYSNGCVREFLISLETGKEIVDTDLKPLKVIEALKSIEDAIKDIESKQIIPESLYQLHRKIELSVTKASLYA